MLCKKQNKQTNKFYRFQKRYTILNIMSESYTICGGSILPWSSSQVSQVPSNQGSPGDGLQYVLTHHLWSNPTKILILSRAHFRKPAAQLSLSWLPTYLDPHILNLRSWGVKRRFCPKVRRKEDNLGEDMGRNVLTFKFQVS